MNIFYLISISGYFSPFFFRFFFLVESRYEHRIVYVIFKAFYLVVYNILLYLCFKLIYIFLKFKCIFCRSFLAASTVCGRKELRKNFCFCFYSCFKSSRGKREREGEREVKKNFHISYLLFWFEIEIYISEKGFFPFCLAFPSFCLIRVKLEFKIFTKAGKVKMMRKDPVSQMNKK